MFVFRFALKNVLSRKSSIIITIFIAFALSLLFLANSIFDSTDTGIKNTFINSFTSDIVIKPKTNFPLSLFGDETPVTGELTTIPELIPFSSIKDLLQNNNNIEEFTPQITGITALNIKNHRFTASAFGVNSKEYFSIMPELKILNGGTFEQNQKGIMLNSIFAQKIKNETGIKLTPGDNIQLISTDGSSFTIRSLPLSGIYEYTVPNQTFERIVLIDAPTLRTLTKTAEIYADDSLFDEEQINLFDDENLFDDVTDSPGIESNGQETEFSAGDKTEIAQNLESTAWHFILCRLRKNASPQKVAANLNMQFKANGINAIAANWRSAAGNSVLMIYYLRVIFNIGIILILLTGFIVVNNTLIISALDRINETGTLRAIGAGRKFITLQFYFETSILTISAGILGCILGFFFCKIINSSDIQIHNLYLIQLFGKSTVAATISFSNAIRCLAISVLLGIIGSIYPAHIALNANPVVAMRGQA